MNSTPSQRPSPPQNDVSLLAALIPIFVLIGLLVLNVTIYHDDASLGPNQIALLIAAGVGAVMGLFYNVPFKEMLKGVHRSIGSALSAVLILLLIGSLIGTWTISGIVPAMIYFGLQILNAKIFLAAAVVVCAIVSVATGSSWSTVGTVGVALMGIGTAMGISTALTAGAIISGAYFGDKMSPLSDTTNLAAAMAGTELFTHIRYMLWTTVPSITITIFIFIVIGYSDRPDAPIGQTAALQSALESRFYLTPFLFVVPLIVFIMVISKFDAIVALFVGTLLGGVAAIVFQPAVVTTIADLASVESLASDNEVVGDAGVASRIQASYLKRSYVALINSMADETSVVSNSERLQLILELETRQLAAAQKQSGDASLTWEQFLDSNLKLNDTFPELTGQIAAADLMRGKGMKGMLNTVWLIICAMCFGGVMEACGFLQRITSSLLRLADSTGSLIATAAGSCIFVNLTASDQYLAIVVPGRMFRETFADRGLAPENLSRTLEDAGTVTSVLVPWNTCGAFQAITLGVATTAFAPFCFFNWISPLMTVLVGFAQFKIAKSRSNPDDARVPLAE